jgi:hypothetical protein
MPTAAEVPGIVAEVARRLQAAVAQGVPLKVSGERLDDDWLYVVVTPTRPGVRASDHASTMSRIERELKQQGTDKVLLVPTIED